MQQTNPPPSEVKESVVVGSIRLQEHPYRVKVPVFEEVVVKTPRFVDQVVEVPVGVEALVEQLVSDGVKKVLDKIELMIGARLDAAIDHRIKEIKSPKIIEEVRVVYKEVLIDKPTFKDVEVSRPIYVDKEILNPIIKDVPVINAKIEDVNVVNAVIQDRVVINPKFEDVVIHRPKFVDKEVTVISLKYVDMKGNPE